jgi:hypothetical protein
MRERTVPQFEHQGRKSRSRDPGPKLGLIRPQTRVINVIPFDGNKKIKEMVLDSFEFESSPLKMIGNQLKLWQG